MMTNRMDKNVKKCVTATLVAGMIASSGMTIAYGDNGFDDANYRGPGYISVVGEVGENGNGGYISSGKGDAGGKSYGLSQFTSKAGGASANTFVSWLKSNYPEMGKNFNGVGKAGTSSFDNAWKKTYNQNPNAFEEAQMEYTHERYVEKALSMTKSKLGVDFSRSRALLELIYSTAVQYGPTGTVQVFSKAGITSSMSDSEIIQKCTDEKQNSVGKYKFIGCSKSVRDSVYKRFAREEKELMDIANGLVSLEGGSSENLKALDDILNETTTLDDVLNEKFEPSLDDVLVDNNEPSLDNASNENSEPSLDDMLVNSEPSLDDMLVDNNESSLDDVLVDSNNPSLDDVLNEDNEPSLDDVLNEDNEPSLDGVITEDNEPSLDDILNNDKNSGSSENNDSVLDNNDVENESIKEESKDEVNNNSNNEEVKDSVEDSTTLDELLDEATKDVDNQNDIVEDENDSKENENTELDIDNKEEKVEENSNVESLENTNDSHEPTEAEKVIASLEETIDNNVFGRLFKTTKMIMDSKMA